MASRPEGDGSRSNHEGRQGVASGKRRAEGEGARRLVGRYGRGSPWRLFLDTRDESLFSTSDVCV